MIQFEVDMSNLFNVQPDCWCCLSEILEENSSDEEGSDGGGACSDKDSDSSEGEGNVRGFSGISTSEIVKSIFLKSKVWVAPDGKLISRDGFAC